MRFVKAASFLGAVGAGLITTMLGSVVVVWLLPAMTTQLMMPVPPLSFNRYLFDDDRARLGERHGLCAVMPSSVSKRTNNGREEQYFL
jgi:hypothetical protein